MSVSADNQERFYRMQVARAWKEIFMGVPERAARWIAGTFLVRWIWRWLFLSAEGELSRAGEIVLADLRNDFLLRGQFHKDPIEMARRVGQREVIEQLFYYLALDEKRVQQLMELDDGFE